MPTSQLEGLRVGWDCIGDGPAVVVFNGIGADRSSTAQTAAWLAAEGFRAITLDNPGAGESDRSGQDCSVGVMADVVAALLDSLAIGQAHLLGHSMGGAISEELAVRRPDLVASLQLHCTWGRTDPYLAALFASWGRLAEAIGPVAIWEHMLLWAVTPTFYDAHPAVIEEWLGSMAANPSCSVEGFRDHVRACVTHDAIDRLGGVTAPTLLTAGEFDRICRPEHTDALRAAMPHASSHIWEGVGHLPFLEAPVAFAETVLAFLRR